jgi:DNA-binding NarL/FixJ family response regulator
VRSLRAGAGGFLLKDTPPAEIVRALRSVAAGEPMLSPTITRRLIGHVTDSGDDERRHHAREQLDRLTEREGEVAVAIGLGKSNAEISRELYMSVATVKAHVAHMLEKLGLNNRVQIALLSRTTPGRRGARLVVEHPQIELPQAFTVGEEVHLDDLPAPDRGARN